MAIVKSLRGLEPQIAEDVFLAETAVVIGDVKIAASCSIWYNAVLRGDVNSITIGEGSNIQDGVVIHTLFTGSKTPSQTHIGRNVSVGHNAIIHGGVIEDDCLIGMGSTILDNAVVGSGCIVAAGALVLAGAKLEPNSLYAGVPAKKIRDIAPEQREEVILRTARDYKLYASWYKE
ncbi:MAG: gamma carbonic anhydrase family protein [Rikenellaceae bacterium]